jgi:hypothetical protein
VGLNLAGGMDVCLLWLLCVCQVEVSATGWSLVQRSPTDCGVWSRNLKNEAKTRKSVVNASKRRRRRWLVLLLNSVQPLLSFCVGWYVSVISCLYNLAACALHLEHLINTKMCILCLCHEWCQIRSLGYIIKLWITEFVHNLCSMLDYLL